MSEHGLQEKNKLLQNTLPNTVYLARSCAVARPIFASINKMINEMEASVRYTHTLYAISNPAWIQIILNIMKNNSSQYLKRIDLRFLQKADFKFLKVLKKEFPLAEIYLVGGAIRDMLLQKKVNDYDFVVRKITAKKLEQFLKTQGTVKLVGRRFGVFKFSPKILKNKKNFSKNNSLSTKNVLNRQYEIALPRQEFALGTGKYQDFKVKSNPNLPIKEDLARRDFTINALALKLGKTKKDCELIDISSGLIDLENHLIRAVGKPKERFQEDYSRILRGLRFSCQLGFRIEEKTWLAIKTKINCLNKKINNERVIPYEVIAKEFLKSFLYNPIKAMDLYDLSGAFKKLIPELLKMKGCPQPKNFHSEGDVCQHTRLAIMKLFSPEFRKQFKIRKPSLQLMVATLFHDIGKPFTIQTPERDKMDRIRFNNHDIVGAKLTLKICQRLKLSSPEKIGINCEKVAWLVQHHMLFVQGDIEKMRASTIEKYFFNDNNPGDELLQLSFADISATIPEKGKPDYSDFKAMLKRIEKIRKLGKNKKQLPKALINGNEIMRAFKLSPGKKIGELLMILREAQLSGKIKNKQQAKRLIKKRLK